VAPRLTGRQIPDVACALERRIGARRL